MHTLLFTLANTVEAAALGNELALPVAHTSLQLLTKFHYKNLYYTGEHRGMQEHSFISRYHVGFVGQEVKRLFLRSQVDQVCYCALQHHTGDSFPLPIPPNINRYVGLSYLLLWPGVTTHRVMMVPQLLQQPRAPTFYTL